MKRRFDKDERGAAAKRVLLTTRTLRALDGAAKARPFHAKANSYNTFPEDRLVERVERMARPGAAGSPPKC
jgi:hypothetical protein